MELKKLIKFIELLFMAITVKISIFKTNLVDCTLKLFGKN